MTRTQALLRRLAYKLARLLDPEYHNPHNHQLPGRNADPWVKLARPLFAFAGRPVPVTLRDGSQWIAAPLSRLQFYPKHIPGTANLREQKNPHAQHTGLDFGPEWRVDEDGYPAAKWRS